MIIYSSPFSQKKQCLHITPGATVSEAVTISGLQNAKLSIYCDDDLIPTGQWDSFILPQNKIITAFVFPAGGDGKNPMRTILMVATLALAVAAPYMTPLVSSGTLGGGLLSAGVGIVGSLAVNAICPPPVVDAGGFASNLGIRNSFSITGSKNQMMPFGVVPKVYGVHRIFPPLAAKPYTELIGNDQYIRMLFCLGLGDLDLSEHKIGETAIADFDDCEIVVGTTENLPSIYETNVQQDNYSLLLPSWVYQTGAGGWPDHSSVAWTVKTAAVNSSEIIVDLHAPQGLFFLDRFAINKKHPLGISLSIQKSVKDSGVWVDIPEFHRALGTWPWDIWSISMVGEDGTALRKSFRFEVDPDDQWEVRIKRRWLSIAGGDGVWYYQDPCHDDHADYLYDDLYWAAMRSVIVTSDSDAPVQAPGMNLVALRIKATEQLSGIVDTYNCVASAKLKTYNGSSWTSPITTSNPAWAYVDVLTGDSNKRPLATSRLDESAMKTWADWCTTNGMEFNAVLNSKSTVFETLRKIAPVGRAAYSIADGQFSIVNDITKTVVVQHFTPRNSWGYKGSKVFVDEVHGFKMPFMNREESWLPDEMIVYADGYTESTATKLEKLEVPGITDADHLWKTGRYYIACAQLRPEKHTLYVDIENLRCMRGDLVKVSHDVPCWGLGWGRVKTVHLSGSDVDEVTTDESFVFETGKTYVARFRTLNNESVLANLVNPGTGEYNTLTFQTPKTGIEVDNLIMFGETDEESVDHIIYSIEPLSDLTARLILVDAAPGVHTADTGTIPTFDSHITQPVDISLLLPAKPVIDSIMSDQAVIISSQNGALVTQMVVNFSVDDFTSTVQAHYRLVESLVDEDDVTLDANRSWRISPPCEASQGNIQIVNVDGDCEYEVLIFAFSPYGMRSEASNIVTHTIEGKNNPPQPVTGFAASVLSEVVRLSWDANDDTDLAYYEIRHGAAWATGTFVSQTFSIEHDTSPSWTGSRTFWIKAFDTSGNESITAATCNLSISAAISSNLTSTITGNLIALKWDISAGTLPVASTETRKGAVFSSATVVGSVNGLNSFAIETGTGSFTYWVVPIDSAGNYGTETFLGVDVDAIIDENADRTPGLPSDESLVGHWSMNDGTGTNVVDSSINNNNGTTQNMEEADWVAGISGKCLEFGGTDERVIVTNDSAFDITDNITISAWVYLTSDQDGWYSGLRKAGNWEFRIRGVNYTTPGLFEVVIFHDDATHTIATSSPSYLVPEQWYHLVMTYEKDVSMKVYVDGDYKNQTTSNITKTIKVRTDDIWIGFVSTYFKGKIDEVRIYDSAITADEVKALYLNPGGLTSINPGADVTGDNTAADIAGQGNLATQNTAAYNTDVTGTPTSLSDVNSAEGTKLTGVATGADVTGDNTAADIAGQGDLAIQDRTDLDYTDGADVTAYNVAAAIINLPATPAGAGLSCDTTHIGYYDGTVWQAFIQNDGKFYFKGDVNNYIQWDGAAFTVKGLTSLESLSALNANLGSITAGNITINSSGFIRGGQTAYGVGTGFFLGYSGAAYKFSIGSTTNYLKFDGADIEYSGKFIGAVAGDYAEHNTNTKERWQQSGWGVVSKVSIGREGTYRVSFEMANEIGGGTVSGRIYKNGVAYGTTRTRNLSSYLTFSEDLSFAIGDTCELWGAGASTTYNCLLRNLKLSVDNPTNLTTSYLLSALQLDYWDF